MDEMEKRLSEETYTPREFISACIYRGYCSKHVAQRYINDVGGRPLLNSDFEEVYHIQEREELHGDPVASWFRHKNTREWNE